MKKICSFLLLAGFISLSACKKEKNEKACWQLVDGVGFDVDLICDKTESEMVDCVKSGACDVYDGLNLDRFDNCSYYKAGGATVACWKITDQDGTYFFRNITENKANLMGRCFVRQPSTVEISIPCQ